MAFYSNCTDNGGSQTVTLLFVFMQMFVWILQIPLWLCCFLLFLFIYLFILNLIKVKVKQRGMELPNIFVTPEGPAVCMQITLLSSLKAFIVIR